MVDGMQYHFLSFWQTQTHTPIHNKQAQSSLIADALMKSNEVEEEKEEALVMGSLDICVLRLDESCGMEYLLLLFISIWLLSVAARAMQII